MFKKYSKILLVISAFLPAVLSAATQYEADILKPTLSLTTGLGDASRNQTSISNSSSLTNDTEAKISKPQSFDYTNNPASDVFGANLFTGAFAREGATQFNPDYVLAIGDTVQVKLWGAFEFDSKLLVDPKGNVFLPHVGPVTVLGVRNKDLQRIVEAAIAKTFKANVSSYASLAAAQPVRIFVSGYVHRPGLYSGTSLDSLLHYIDQAGGIDAERGSFLKVEVKRGHQVRATINFYDFLLNGNIPTVQLADNDVIFVTPRQNTVKVSGLAENAKRFEFIDSAKTVADLARVAKPLAAATHVRVIRNKGVIKNTEYYPLADANKVQLQNGDELEFTADKKPGTITVRVEGEHLSSQEYVLPYGARIADILKQIEYSERSDSENLQLFRISVKDRQKAMLQAALKTLENTALTARSGTNDEAILRKTESELILQWVERAKNIEPTGQVVISQAEVSNDLLLENGDVLRVPIKDGLILVNGEVLFPNTIAFNKNYSIDDYVRKAGGYTQNADLARVVVAHRDGSYTEAAGDKGFFTLNTHKIALKAGDQILVLPKIDIKSRQIFKEVTQIMYQIAVSARIVFGL